MKRKENPMAKITVSQKHIEQGQAGNCWACPIALALREATGKVWQVGAEACWPIPSWAPSVVLPRIAQSWMKRFDGGNKVRPLTFELNVKLSRRAQIAKTAIDKEELGISD